MVEIALFVLGFVLLIWGSDVFVDAASRVAKGFGVSEFLIALILASIATTLPEVTVSAVAAFHKNSGIALGNAVGSALANISLILGVSSIIRPLEVDTDAWKNALFMLGITLYSAILMYDGTISRLDGLTLVLIYFGFLYFLHSKHVRLGYGEVEGGNPRRDLLIMLGSGLAVVLGARVVVSTAVELARTLGIPEVVIGLTLVSVGTSMPELANSLTATLKNLPNISVGNIVGANILDILMVIGIAALIHPIRVDPGIFSFTLPLTLLVMGLLTGILRLRSRVDRMTGAAFLAVYSYFLYVQFGG